MINIMIQLELGQQYERNSMRLLNRIPIQYISIHSSIIHFGRYTTRKQIKKLYMSIHIRTKTHIKKKKPYEKTRKTNNKF